MLLLRGWIPAGIVLATLLAPPGASAQGLPRVVIQTELGSMEVEIDTVQAPAVAGNFLRYVDQGAYRGGRFHRTVRPDNQPENQVKIGVIQGGLDSTRAKDFGPTPLERAKDSGLSRRDGAISLAPDAPASATSDFFISIGPQPELNFGGDRIGKVVRGMEVAKLIQTARAQGQRLTPAIGIVNVTRVR